MGLVGGVGGRCRTTPADNIAKARSPLFLSVLSASLTLATDDENELGRRN